jgi:hypothetical protein
VESFDEIFEPILTAEVKPAGQSMNLTANEIQQYKSAFAEAQNRETKRDSRSKDIKVNELTLSHIATKKLLAFAQAEVVKLTLKIQEMELQKEESVLRLQNEDIRQELSVVQPNEEIIAVSTAVKQRMGIPMNQELSIDTEMWTIDVI